MPMCPIFWNKNFEWVSIAQEKSACKKLLMRPSYSQAEKSYSQGPNRMG